MTKPSIVPVLEHYEFHGLQDYGGWRPVKCVWHGDRRASGSYNPDLGVYKCHVCDISGDAYAVVMKVEGIGFDEAKRRVQEITGHDGSQLPGQSSGGWLRGRSRSKLPGWARAKHAARLLL